MKNKKIFILLLLIPIIIFFIGRSFSLEQEIKSIEIQSEDYPNPGSWHITKSAEWTEFGKAKVTFDVDTVTKSVIGLENNMDVVFVIDTSNSMAGDKLDRVKRDAIDLADYLMSNPNNKIALIVFDNYSEIKTDFTNNKSEIMDMLNGIEHNVRGDTSYYEALYNVEVLMNGYEKEDNKDVVLLFLTDGYPNKDSPGEVAWYHVLKEEFPYMTMNGIQYEMGTDIIQEIIDITDNQWVADMSTLHNVLFDATVAPLAYEEFIITDYIDNDYFYVNSINDVKADHGDISLDVEGDVQKITWNLGDNYKMGQHSMIEINISLKDDFNDVKGLYKTNKEEYIITKSENNDEIVVHSELTPILKNKYNVLYQIPNECVWDGIDSEEYFVGETVTIREDWPSCPGYLFKGYQIDSNDNIDIQMINDDTFFMPGHNVTIRGIWTKQKISKSTTGSVHAKATLYNVFKEEYDNGNLVEKSDVKYYDAYEKSLSTQDVYYWYTSNYSDINSVQNKYNVIFANHCWQMIRTTDTGGVKLLYNGEPENGTCYTYRGTHVGYTRMKTITINGSYYYGTDYTYNNNFKISGEVASIQWNSTNADSLVGKYTCLSTNQNESCSTLYLVNSYKNENEAYAIPIDANSHYSQFGKLQYNDEKNALSYVGYMHNTVIPAKKKELKYTEYPIQSGYMSNSTFRNYYFGYGVNWGSPVQDNYNLVWAYKPEYAYSLRGAYTFLNSDSSYTSNEVYYFIDATSQSSGASYNYIVLSDGELNPSSQTYTIGNSYIDNGDGTYTIVNRTYSNGEYVNGPATTFRRIDWNNSNHSGNIICKNAVNDTCSDLWFMKEVFGNQFSYLRIQDNFKYGSDYTYNSETNKYELSGDVFSTWDISQHKSKMNDHHYTCFNVDGECETLYYIFWSYDTWYYFTAPYYVELKNGQSIDDVLNLSLYSDNVNQKDSVMKFAIDKWYEHFMIRFDDYIEDAVYCNDRSRNTYFLDGWNPNGGLVPGKSLPSFGLDLPIASYEFTRSICSNDTDRFSTTNNKAKLNYKVGLITYNELENFGDYNNIRSTGETYWTLTPSIFSEGQAEVVVVTRNGSYNTANVSAFYNDGSNDGSAGVRPVISLKSGTEYKSGDGSMEHPYLIDDGTH